MKKLLIATTALVATAGVAAAEVTISGNGRMGVVYNGDDLNFSSRVRADVNLKGTTDGGLEFGGSFGMHNAGDRSSDGDISGSACGTIDDSGVPEFYCFALSGSTSGVNGGGANVGNSGSIYISGAFGKLEMGDVVGAAEAVVGDLPEIGFTDIANNDTAFLTGDGAEVDANNPALLYTYTTGGLTFAVSFNDGISGNGVSPFDDEDQAFAVGVKYAFGDYAVSLGYESLDFVGGGSADHVVVGVDATMGTTALKLIAGQGSSGSFDYTHVGLGVTSTFDAMTIKAMVKSEDFDGFDVMSYGLGAEYDLGGGAVVAGGIADNDLSGSNAVADLGLKFSF